MFDRLKRLLGLGGAGDGASTTGNAGGDVRMIECHEAMERLFEFLDRELDPGEHEEVAHHFEVCARCYPALTFEQSFREALRRAQGGEDTRSDLRTKVIEALQQEGFTPSDR